MFAWTLTAQAAGSGSGVVAVSTTETSAAIVPAESSVVGTIDHFEESGRRLILQTHDGHVTFVLASDAIVRMGSKTLPPGELGAQKGRKAKVRYTVSGSRRTAHWVVISSDPPRVTE
jgi:hypothetical protein